ncbi:MAG: phosphoesterase PA-phosphatase related protein, partial [Frankiales bacterium]|nr:phosphoesterase PA-phosphatase related protein [Frankiales bacterium]
RLFLDVNRFARHTAWLHGLATAYIKVAVALLALLVVAGFLLSRGRDSQKVAASVWTGVGALLAVALNQPLVHHFNERRPFVALPHVLLLTKHGADPGLPSDHATLAGAVMAGLFFVDRRLGVAAVVVGVLLAADRVYVGVHYPGDVLAGLALGALVAVVGWLALRNPLTAVVRRLRSGSLRRLLGPAEVAS